MIKQLYTVLKLSLSNNTLFSPSDNKEKNQQEIKDKKGHTQYSFAIKTGNEGQIIEIKRNLIIFDN